MKRILIVVPSLGIGGQERIALNTAKSLSATFDAQMVVFQKKEKEYHADGVVVHQLNCPAQKTGLQRVFAQVKRAIRLARMRKRLSVDVVYSLGMTANLTNVLSGLVSRGKTVIAIHGFAEVKKCRINTFMLKRADAAVCIAQDMQHQLLKLYPDLTNTVVIENGYELEAAFRAGAREKAYDARAPKIIAMGRLDDVKRYDLLLRAFAIVTRSVPDARLSFLGQGEREQDLKDLAGSLGLERSVRFLGYRENPFDELASNDIFALTSKTEGFPNALIEALGCGLAAVSVDCPSGPREILSERYSPTPVQGVRFEKYGVLVENTADEAQLADRFAAALLQLIRAQDTLQCYQNEGRSHASEYSLDVYEKKLCDLFRALG